MDTYCDEYHYGLNYVIGDLAALKTFEIITTYQMRQLLDMAMSSRYCAYQLAHILWETKFLDQVEGDELLNVVRQVISEQPKTVSDIKGGKDKAVGALVGAVMKKIKADPSHVKELFLKEIHEN